jgi:hypothetical protein
MPIHFLSGSFEYAPYGIGGWALASAFRGWAACKVTQAKTDKRKHTNTFEKCYTAVPHHFKHGRAVLLWLIKHFNFHIVSFVD